MSNINLSQDQNRLIDMYISQYNLVNSQINRLYDMLDDIRYNIQNTININNNNNNQRRTNTNTNTNTFLNRYIENLINEERQNNFVFYDYNNPINPSLYSNRRQPSSNNRQHTSNNRQSTSNNRQSNQYTRNRTNNLFRNNNTDVSRFLSNFLNTNVIVRPTIEEIDRASRIIRYGDIENPLSESCPISLEYFNNDDLIRQIIHCGHIFCQNSFQTWFNSNVRCPVCRYDIRNTSSTSPTSINATPSNNTSTPNNTPSNNSPSNNATTNNIPSTSSTNSNLFTNVNVTRNPETNQIDQVAFDLTNNLLSNELLNNITSRMFQNILQPDTENDRLIFDPSNNILLFETIISNVSNINNNRNNDYDSGSDNEYSNIV
jgi:hypothetical protein